MHLALKSGVDKSNNLDPDTTKKDMDPHTDIVEEWVAWAVGSVGASNNSKAIKPNKDPKKDNPNTQKDLDIVEEWALGSVGISNNKVTKFLDMDSTKKDMDPHTDIDTDTTKKPDNPNTQKDLDIVEEWVA